VWLDAFTVAKQGHDSLILIQLLTPEGSDVASFILSV